MRQLLADKVSGTLVGLWLLVPEHLRLGVWDLLEGWTGQPGAAVQPRLALQLVHEAALCVAGRRGERSLSQKGFELANGLPFVASDQAVHDLLVDHTMADAQALQTALGRIRRASGHYQGRLLAIDPHHMRSYTRRQTRRHRHKETELAVKTSQTFWCLDADTEQPVGFTCASAARTVTQATPELLQVAEAVLQPKGHVPLVLADGEHLSCELFNAVADQTPFDLLAPMPNSPNQRRQMQRIPPEHFRRRWAGMATATQPYRFTGASDREFLQIVQRCGEQPDAYQFKGFLTTTGASRDELLLLCRDFPKRWHIEEFFNTHQALGWSRAGTLNLNVRYGQMTLALVAQAALHQLRERLGDPYRRWEARHLARELLRGLDGDIRVSGDTILVTFYNAPNVNQLQRHYQHLPAKLAQENVDPRIPWLYDLKLDFRFR